MPSDLLTACSEGEPVPSASEAVSRVKGHVKAMKKMIDAARKQELEEEVRLSWLGLQNEECRKCEELLISRPQLNA